MAEWYTVDDLQRPKPNRREVTFTDWRAALADYRALPATGVKALGFVSGNETVDLVRCIPLFPLDREGEDALVINGWNKDPKVVQAAEEFVSALQIRYCLKENCLLPRPEKASAKIRDKQLWSGDGSVRWLYVAGVGLLSPAEFERRYAQRERGGFCYPLVLNLQVDAKTKDGSLVALEVSPWDFERLKAQSSINPAPRHRRGA